MSVPSPTPDRPAAAPSGPPSIPFVTLTNWVRAAALCHINIEAVFREVGISNEQLNPETAVVQIDVFYRLMALCCERAHASGAQHFPFALGETFAFEYLSDMETYVTTSPTLRASLQVLEWLRILVNPTMHISVIESGEQARMRVALDYADAAPDISQRFVEGIYASILRFARLLLGDDEALPFLHLTLRHAPPNPTHQRRCEAFFQMPVQFDAPENALIFPARLLDMPLRGAFPTLHQQAEQRVQQRLAQMPKRTELVAAIEQAFIARPALFGQSVDAMALHLGLHPRTLQRRLRDEGQSFSSVLAQVRFRLASQWLREGKEHIEDIAERLGFADRRSFTQAFSRWAGCTPSQYRQGPR